MGPRKCVLGGMTTVIKEGGLLRNSGSWTEDVERMSGIGESVDVCPIAPHDLLSIRLDIHLIPTIPFDPLKIFTPTQTPKSKPHLNLLPKMSSKGGSDEEHVVEIEDDSSSPETQEEIPLTDPSSFLFIGPLGKKRRMVREREKSGESSNVKPLSERDPERDPDRPEDDERENGEGKGQDEPLNLTVASPSPRSSPPEFSSKVPVIVEQWKGRGSTTGEPETSSQVSVIVTGSPPRHSQFSPAASASLSSPTTSTASKESCGRKKLACPDCGKEFSQLRNYRYHRSRHEGSTQFACTCPVCGKTFNDKGYLSSHLKIHRNAKEYQCEWCTKSFNQRVAYNMHVRIHTGHKPHKCHLCTKAFSRKMLLRQHLRTHTGERPYTCEVCGKAFADRSNMLLHQRLHTGQRPYRCDICGKSFSKNHHLKTHLNHHAGIKPYQCEKCKATFSQSSNMKTHFRKCTGIVSPPCLVSCTNFPSSAAGSAAAAAASSSPFIPPYEHFPHDSTLFGLQHQETIRNPHLLYPELNIYSHLHQQHHQHQQQIQMQQQQQKSPQHESKFQVPLSLTSLSPTSLLFPQTASLSLGSPPKDIPLPPPLPSPPRRFVDWYNRPITSFSQIPRQFPIPPPMPPQVLFPPPPPEPPRSNQQNIHWPFKKEGP